MCKDKKWAVYEGVETFVGSTMIDFGIAKVCKVYDNNIVSLKCDNRLPDSRHYANKVEVFDSLTGACKYFLEKTSVDPNLLGEYIFHKFPPRFDLEFSEYLDSLKQDSARGVCNDKKLCSLCA